MNQNFLSNSTYKFVNKKFKDVEFFCASVDLPSISVDPAPQINRFSDIQHPGDKVTYSDLTLSFRVDSELKNYILISNWLKNLKNLNYAKIKDEISDSKILIYNYANVHIMTFTFIDSFPVSLGGVSFSSENTDDEFVSVETTFAFSEYNIETNV